MVRFHFNYRIVFQVFEAVSCRGNMKIIHLLYHPLIIQLEQGTTRYFLYHVEIVLQARDQWEWKERISRYNKNFCPWGSELKNKGAQQRFRELQHEWNRCGLKFLFVPHIYQDLPYP